MQASLAVPLLVGFLGGVLLAWFWLSDRLIRMRFENYDLRARLARCDAHRWTQASVAWQTVDASGGANVYNDDKGGPWIADPYRRGFRSGRGLSPLLAVLDMRLQDTLAEVAE